MNPESYFYNCSPEYIQFIDQDLYNQVLDSIKQLPKRQTQSEINADLFWLLVSLGWFYDTIPPMAKGEPPVSLNINAPLSEITKSNSRKACLTSTTLNTRWHTDFAKYYGSALVQVEAQFGKVEAMFKDFCGFRIAYAERRLSLGIEIVLSNPSAYFAHRKNAIGGMANFEIAKSTLNTIGLNCPIWLIGIIE